jgi:hypothetical protein
MMLKNSPNVPREPFRAVESPAVDGIVLPVPDTVVVVLT